MDDPCQVGAPPRRRRLAVNFEAPRTPPPPGAMSPVDLSQGVRTSPVTRVPCVDESPQASIPLEVEEESSRGEEPEPPALLLMTTTEVCAGVPVIVVPQW